MTTESNVLAPDDGGEDDRTLHEIEAVLSAEPDQLVIRNEFACVGVRVRDPGGRPRLRIEDLRTRQVIELDALELETLAWSQHVDLTPLLDPSAARWTDRPRERGERNQHHDH